jgi:hypothetical protein
MTHVLIVFTFTGWKKEVYEERKEGEGYTVMESQAWCRERGIGLDGGSGNTDIKEPTTE